MYMRRQIISFVALVGAMATVGDVMAQDPGVAARRVEIEDMLERGRWGEAYEALSALEGDVDPMTMSHDAEWASHRQGGWAFA